MKVEINISNRVAYSILAVLIVILIGISVYAATVIPTVDTKPNPGHSVAELGIPAGCNSNSLLYWNGTTWTCITSFSQQGYAGYFNGLIRLVPHAGVANCEEGTIFYHSANYHFYGCSHGTLKQLDN